jgi:hypothetical protein
MTELHLFVLARFSGRGKGPTSRQRFGKGEGKLKTESEFPHLPIARAMGPFLSRFAGEDV